MSVEVCMAFSWRLRSPEAAVLAMLEGAWARGPGRRGFEGGGGVGGLGFRKAVEEMWGWG